MGRLQRFLMHFYKLDGGQRLNETLKGVSGTWKLPNVSNSVAYGVECFNTYAQDSATKICFGSKYQDTVIINVLGAKPLEPTLTAESDCSNKKITVNWTDTADTANDATGYYKFSRDGVSLDSNLKGHILIPTPM